MNLFPQTLALMTAIIEDGQRQGEIRTGNPSALIHLSMTLVYEHVFLVATENPGGSLTLDEFQDLIDGALRATRCVSRPLPHG